VNKSSLFEGRLSLWGVSTLSLQAKNSGFEVEKPLSFPASLP